MTIKQTTETYGDYIQISDPSTDEAAAELLFDKVISDVRKIVLQDIGKYFIIKDGPLTTTVGFKISLYKREIDEDDKKE